MKRSFWRIAPALCAGGVVAFAASAAQPAPQAQRAAPMIVGFTPSASTTEYNVEQRFDALLNAGEMRAWMKRLTSEPNQVGSPHDKANAEFILSEFRKWGWKAHIEKFEVMYPTPSHELVQMVAPTKFTATLREPPVPGDRTSTVPGALPAYNVYGPDGDVTADLVYVNYGMPADYRELARLGVSVKGKIVIVRYGAGWRGLKPRLAYEHGAIGCIIYSDPASAGYFHGDAYPKGGWRPGFGIQRGSVADQAQYYPGDPTTPGYAPVPGAKHVAVADAKPIQKIPVIPISYDDATPLLKAMTGPVAPKSWRGALGFTYHVGPGAAKVHLVVKSNWHLEPIYDVIATLPGSSDANQWVIRGNHHDGWVFGAYDPMGGTVALMGEAKAMGTLYKDGWRPKRTIVYASWDGEEPGLLGSTAWAEDHAAELKQKAVLYLNSDTNGRGFLFAGGNPSYQRMVNQVATGVVDPETGATVEARLRARVNVLASEKGAPSWAKQEAKAISGEKDIPLAPLGSGSDYSTFLDHLGVPTLTTFFGGEGSGFATYHSRYDSFDHFIRFGDPTFKYEVALAEVAGHIVMRVADADVLPMQFGAVGGALKGYMHELQTTVDSDRRAAKQQHRLLDAHDYQLGSDPEHPTAPPARLPDVPARVDLKPLSAAVASVATSADKYDAAYRSFLAGGLEDTPATKLRRINGLLATMSQRLTQQEGLPGRAWYKNFVWAPSTLAGYGASTFPAVSESLDAYQWDDAARNAVLTANVLNRYRQQLDELTQLLDEAAARQNSRPAKSKM